jgi:hypothetical protein
VILIVPPGTFTADRRLAPGRKVAMGTSLGTFSSARS